MHKDSRAPWRFRDIFCSRGFVGFISSEPRNSRNATLDRRDSAATCNFYLCLLQVLADPRQGGPQPIRLSVVDSAGDVRPLHERPAMKAIACACAVLFAAATGVAFADAVGPSDPPGWYLEGGSTRAGPFGSAGLCQDIARRQATAGARCVEYGRGYWLVVDLGDGRVSALAPAPYASLDACLVVRAQTSQASAYAECTRRVPTRMPTA